MTRTFCILIPARKGSKRIPGKNLHMVGGKPLVYWTVTEAMKLNLPVYVSSDWPELLEYVASLGARIIARPKELSHDHVTTEMVINHAKEEIIRTKKHYHDYMICLQPTSPCFRYWDIDAGIEKITYPYDSCFSAFSLEAFQWIRKEHVLEPQYNFKARPRSQDISWPIVENGAFYIFPWIGNIWRFGKNPTYTLMSMPESIQIDDITDMAIAEMVLRGQGRL